jgi:two-component sensor histidine kinase
MTTLYDRIYSSIDIGEDIELRATVSALAEQLAARYPDAEPDIRTYGEKVYIPRDAATPVSIMVNELMTNAVKYGATAGDAPPQIDVELRRTGSGTAGITIRDKGPGFPDTVLDGTAPGFGLSIVQELARQVNAELAVRNGEHGGGEVSLLLPAAADPE